MGASLFWFMYTDQDALPKDPVWSVASKPNLTQGDDRSSTSVPTSKEGDADARVVVPEVEVSPTFQQAIENPSTELDIVPIPIYTKGTVLSAMEAHQASTSFSFTGRTFPGLGVFVESIQGRPNADGMYWILYVNDAPASLGASRFKVTSGDVVEWRYEESLY